MPCEIQIIRAGEFVRLDPQEHLDFESSKHALRLLAAACRKRGIDHAILDLRNIPIPGRPLFNREELIALVKTFHEAGFTCEQRLAVLYRLDPHRGIRKFAFISTLQGWRVRVFTDFEKALTWLSEEDIGEGHSDAQQIPVRTKRKLQVTCH